MKKNKLKIIFTAAFALACSVSLPSTSKADEELDRLMDMSLEELMDYQLYSVSKRPEKLSEVPAAAFVLTSDDISKSGATSIPEALRLVLDKLIDLSYI